MSSKMKTLFALHLLLMLYSVASLCSKAAAGEPFLSPRFCLFYGGVIALLGIYALGWQQVLKRLPLTTAYSNRAVVIVWGMIWGALIFAEAITPAKVVGAALIIAGIVLFSRADAESAEGPSGEAGDAPSAEAGTAGGGSDG